MARQANRIGLTKRDYKSFVATLSAVSDYTSTLWIAIANLTTGLTEYISYSTLYTRLRTHPITSASATYTILAADEIVLCDGTFTVTLQAASARAGIPVTIKNIGVGVITVDGAGAETIDSNLTISILSMESYALISDGSNWWII
jgi:hypothetical protein